ncbi:hypothetical protein WAX74_10470 [Psychrobacillus sp. FJAT-51614]|uniref:Uncharacterized protein n=1 Tax=Psychrobacillus mangrovi TaxID=3117745 RepID=A0ABU8F4X7_9BACI
MSQRLRKLLTVQHIAVLTHLTIRMWLLGSPPLKVVNNRPLCYAFVSPLYMERLKVVSLSLG